MDSLLQDVYERDQSIRIQLMEVTKAITADGKVELIDSLIILTEKEESIDSLNMEIIDSLLQKGLPKRLKPESYKTIWLVIDHATLEYQEKYIPLIKDMSEENLIDADNYAILYDRVRMKNNLPQKYGTQSVQFGTPDSMKLYIWPIEKPSLVDSLRGSVGLSPMDDYIRQLTEVTGIEAEFDQKISVEQINRLRKIVE